MKTKGKSEDYDKGHNNSYKECTNNDASRQNVRRWLEDVIADLRRMGFSGWMEKATKDSLKLTHMM